MKNEESRKKKETHGPPASNTGEEPQNIEEDEPGDLYLPSTSLAELERKEAGERPGESACATGEPLKAVSKSKGLSCVSIMFLIGVLLWILTAVARSIYEPIRQYVAPPQAYGMLTIGGGLALSYVIAWLLVILSLVVVLIREVRAVLNLRRFGRVRELCEKIQKGELGSDAEREAFYKEVEGLCNYLGGGDLNVDENGLTEVKSWIDDRRSPENIYEHIDKAVLAGLDTRARKLTEEAALKAAGVVALSPSFVLDALVVIWYASRIIRQIAELYGVRPGVVGTVRILGWVLGTATFAMITQQFARIITAKKAGTSSSLPGILVRSGTAVAQGITTGLLFYRIGIAASYHIRPVPHKDKTQARMSKLARGFIKKLAFRFSKEDQDVIEVNPASP